MCGKCLLSGVAVGRGILDAPRIYHKRRRFRRARRPRRAAGFDPALMVCCRGRAPARTENLISLRFFAGNIGLRGTRRGASPTNSCAVQNINFLHYPQIERYRNCCFNIITQYRYNVKGGKNSPPLYFRLYLQSVIILCVWSCRNPILFFHGEACA